DPCRSLPRTRRQMRGSTGSRDDMQKARAFLSPSFGPPATGPWGTVVCGCATSAAGWLRPVTRSPPSQRRRGYAADTLLALTGFGWTVPGLARIVLHVEPWNIASQRTAERAGYVRQEATADHRIFSGETREMVVYEAVRP